MAPKILVSVGLIAAVAAAGIVWAVRSSGTGRTGATPAPAMTADEMADIVRDMRIVPFTGITHRGEPADESIVRGGWTVVSFGFTYCTLACPTLHREIYRAADRLADRGVRFVTISVDPAHDTVEQMASHVAQWGVRGDCWTFVRVEADALPGILAELKMPALSDDTANMITLPGGERMANIQHPTRFFVTGPDGTVRGLWRGTDPSEVDAMIRWLLERPR